MVKSISKKIFSILMIFVLMFSVFTIPVRAEAITVTTAVGVAVVAAALIAAGVYIASPQTREAINAAALDFINHNATFLQTIKLVATATGKVFAIWSSSLWNSFTDWIKNVLCIGGVSMASGYAMQVASSLPQTVPLSDCTLLAGITGNAMQDIYIGGSRLTNAYGSSSIFSLYLSNGHFTSSQTLNSAYTLYRYQGYWGTPSQVVLYYPPSGQNTNARYLAWSLGPAVIYGANIYGFRIANGYVQAMYSASGYYHNVCSGFDDVNKYLWACVSAGIFFGDWSWLQNGQGLNVPVRDHYSPEVRVRFADNSIPGLSDAQSGLIGAIGGTLPITANPGQNIMTPVWGTWTNGQGIPIGWAGPQGTYGTPSSTITPGQTIPGTGTSTANPPITYPGDDVINPTLGRKGVATFPTIGDDVINPADDTFITDLDDYIDPTIDQLTTPTDVSTLTQNPTDVVGPTTDVFPESDDIPNTIRDTATDTIPDVDSPAIPDVDTATDTATPVNPDASDDTSTDERNTNRLKLSTLILSKFPFCIPWDIYRTVATMVQEPEIPSFDWRFSLPSFNVDETIHIDFEQFETVAYIVRWFLSACWLVTLVLLTRKVIWK